MNTLIIILIFLGIIVAIPFAFVILIMTLEIISNIIEGLMFWRKKR